jgi:hypothetical protein
MALRPMLVLLDDLAYLDDLCAHFRRSGFGADPAGGLMVELALRGAPSREQEVREIRLHLDLWRVLNPGRRVAEVPH